MASGGRQSPERQGDPEFGLFVVQRFGARTKSRGAKKSSAKFSSFDTFDPDKAFEEGELVVVNAPSGFAEGARSLGFVVLERIQLGSIGMTAFRVRIPPRTKMDAARRSLAGRFPGAIIDANHQFDMSAERRRSRSRTATGQKKKKAIQSRVRAAIGWQKVAHTCGRNVTLGMIDSGLDMSHPALKGQKIEFKSFHNRKRRQGNSNHGTAVAAILVGKPSNKGWGGLFQNRQDGRQFHRPLEKPELADFQARACDQFLDRRFRQ